MPSPDEARVLAAFLEAFWKDVEKHGVRPIADYLAEFPGPDAAIRQHYSAFMDAGTAGLTSGRPTQQDDNRVGHYNILRQIGRGGQATVYLAEDITLRRRVALKVVDPGLTPDSKAFERFKREAEMTSRLDHPGICAIYETGEHRGSRWIAMRYVEGESLAARISQAKDLSMPPDLSGDGIGSTETSTEPNPPSGPRTWAEIAKIVQFFEEAARTLHAAHEAGVIHRDVKPGNIMVSRDGVPVILDFGLAQDTDSNQVTLTLPGDLPGTAAYMSPEQIAAQRIRLDRRTDVYSLGVSLYECLTLERPFDAPTREGTYQAILTKTPQDVRRRNPTVSFDLKVVLDTSIEKDRDCRYQTAFDFAEDLRRVRVREPIRARPAGLLTRLGRWAQRDPRLAAALGALLLALAAGMVVALILLGREQTALRRSEALRLTSQSKIALPDDPALALLLALEAADRMPSIDTNNALLESLSVLDEEKTWFGMTDVTMTASGGSLAMTSAAGRVTLVDAERGFAETAVEGFPGDAAQSVINPAGDGVVTIGLRGGAAFCSRGKVTILVPPERVAHFATFSADGERLFVCAQSEVQLWNMKTVELTKATSAEYLPEVCCNESACIVGISPVGKPITVFLPDSDASVPIEAPGEGASKGRVHASLNSNGDRLVTWHTLTGTSRLHSSDGWKPIAAYHPHAGVTVAAFSTGASQLVAAGHDDGTVSLWNAVDGMSTRTLAGHHATVTSLAFSADGGYLATGSADHDVRVWNVSTGDCIAILRGHSDEVRRVFAGPGARRVVSLGLDQTVRIWNPLAKAARDTASPAEAHALLPALSPLGPEVASVEGSGAEALRSLPCEPAREFRRAADTYLASLQRLPWWTAFRSRNAVFSPNGQWIAGILDDGRVAIRSMQAGEHPRALEAVPPRITFLGFSPDSRMLVVRSDGHADGDRCLIGLQPGSQPTWLADAGMCRHVIHVSRDGQLAATLSLDSGQPVILRTQDGMLLSTLSGATQRIATAAFSADGKRLIGGGESGGVWVWDLDRPAAPFLAVRHSGGLVRSAAFNEAGTFAVTAGDDGTARVWSLERGREHLTIRVAGLAVLNAVFSQDQQRVITLDSRGATRGWPIFVEAEAARRSPRRLTPDEVDRFETMPREAREAYRTK